MRLLLEDSTNPSCQELGEIFGPFDETDTKSWNLTPIHLIVLGFSSIDLESYLAISTTGIDSQDRFGKTALMWASIRNDRKAVQTLLKFGARLDLVDNYDCTVFQSVFSTESLKLLLEALEKHSTYNQAIENFSQKLNGSTPNSGLSPRNLPEEYIGNYNACRALLDRPNSSGYSPLLKAVQFNEVTSTRLFIRYGADLNAGQERNPPQGTPLLMAVQYNLPLLIKLLIDSDARTDVKDLDQQSILHLAAMCCDYNTIYLLATLELKGLNPDDRDVNGCTAWQLFDEERPIWRRDEDLATRARAKKAFEKLVESVSQSEPAATTEDVSEPRDSEEDSLSSDVDEFFDCSQPTK